MAEVLEEFQLSVGSLGKNGCAEGLHDLLHGDILVRELVSSGAARVRKSALAGMRAGNNQIPTYQTRPKAPMPTGWRSEYLCSRGMSVKLRSLRSDRCIIPRGDLERCAENLGADKLGHDDEVCVLRMRDG